MFFSPARESFPRICGDIATQDKHQWWYCDEWYQFVGDWFGEGFLSTNVILLPWWKTLVPMSKNTMGFRVFTSTEMIGPNIRHEFEMKNGRLAEQNVATTPPKRHFIDLTKRILPLLHPTNSSRSPKTNKETNTLPPWKPQKVQSWNFKTCFWFSQWRPGCCFCCFIWVVCLHPRVLSLAKAWLIVPMKKLKTINPAGRFCRNWKANTGQRCSHGQLVLFGKQSKIFFWFRSRGPYMSLSCHEHQFEPISALDVSVYIVFPSARFWYG